MRLITKIKITHIGQCENNVLTNWKINPIVKDVPWFVGIFFPKASEAELFRAAYFGYKKTGERIIKLTTPRRYKWKQEQN